MCAEVVELVDTLDLGSSAARRGGSSPLFGTIQIIQGFEDIKIFKPFFYFGLHFLQTKKLIF